MSRKQKITDRLKFRLTDFTYNEARTLLGLYGFVEDTKGKTSGSRVMFVNKNLNMNFRLHRPYPSNVLKNYQVKELYEFIQIVEVLENDGV